MLSVRMRGLRTCLACLLVAVSCLISSHVVAGTALANTEAIKIQKPASLLTIPLGRGLPVVVRTGLSFQALDDFDEGKGIFEATADLRMSWLDLRLSYPASEVLHGYKEYRVSAAEAQLAAIFGRPGFVTSTG